MDGGYVRFLQLLARWCVALVFLWRPSLGAYGPFNLYLNETETHRLLGIEGEIWYVRDSMVNTYALTFNMPIRPEVSELYFTWQDLKTATNRRMQYHVWFTWSNHEALHSPIVNIPPQGYVPNTVSGFCVTLKCTHQVSTEVDIVMHINVTLHNATHPTPLQVRRKKSCRKAPRVSGGVVPGRDPYVFGDDGRVTDTLGDADTVEDERNKGEYSSTSSHALYIALGVGCGVILLVALVLTVWYCRPRKHTNERLSDTSSAALTAKSQYTKVDTPSTSVAGLPPSLPQLHQQSPLPQAAQPPAAPRPLSPFTELTPQDTDTIIHQLHIDRKKLSLGEILMEGTFGKIYRGTMLIEGENVAPSEMEVYVKTVTDAASPGQIDTMLRESCMLKGQFHTNINPVIASCLEGGNQPPLLLFPYLNQGNLNTFLHRSRLSDLASQQSFNTQQYVYMAIQVVRGVQFLHKHRILHRDIATRNCVVNHQLIVRVSDRGLARDLFPGDYHCLGDNDNRPVKWLAYEALLDRKFSYASDVWSFGVTLWEIMTCGQQPYADVDPFEMAAYLKEGYRVSQPLNCPDELFAVMACCWSLNPEERPTMAQLQVCMQDFYAALGRFI